MGLGPLVGCQRREPVPAEESAPKTPEPVPEPRDRLCAGVLEAPLRWRLERGAADESEEPLPAVPEAGTLRMEAFADGTATLSISAPEMRARASCDGEELRAEFRGRGDGILLLRREDGRFRGVLRAAPEDGRTSLVADVELAPEATPGAPERKTP